MTMRSTGLSVLTLSLLLAACGQREPEPPAPPTFNVSIDGVPATDLVHAFAHSRRIDRAARYAKLGLPPPAKPQATLYDIQLFADPGMSCARLLLAPHRPVPDERSAELSLAEGEARGSVRVGNQYNPTSEIELVEVPARVGDTQVMRLRQPVAWTADGPDGRIRRFELSGEFRARYCGEQGGG